MHTVAVGVGGADGTGDGAGGIGGGAGGGNVLGHAAGTDEVRVTVGGGSSRGEERAGWCHARQPGLHIL